MSWEHILEWITDHKDAPDWARRDPDLESLHDDPRFWELLGT